MNECSPENEKEEREMLERERKPPATRDDRLREYLRLVKASMGAGTPVIRR